MRKKHRLGILVSDDYDNFSKIKNIIYDAKCKLTDKLQVCQVNGTYMHNDIKKFILEIGVEYTELNRFDEPFSIYSYDQNEHKFSKPFNGKYYHIRNSAFVMYCNGIFLFERYSHNRSQLLSDILTKINSKKSNFKIFT